MTHVSHHQVVWPACFAGSGCWIGLDFDKL